jgi:hypothetical protein
MSRRTVRAAVAIAAATTAGGVLPALPAAPAQAAPARYADDFNGDGYRDYAAYTPGEWAVGGVEVTYGTASGPGTRRQIVDQNSPGVPDGSEQDDMFGAVRTSADFNRDGYADLAVSAPGEDISGRTDQGSVTVLWGSASGLSGGTSIPNKNPNPYDRLGSDLAAGDFNGDGKPDLAVIDSTDAYIFRGDISRSGVSGAVSRLVRSERWLDATQLIAGRVNGDAATDLVVVGAHLAAGERFTEAWFVRGGTTVASGPTLNLSNSYLGRFADGVVADFNRDGYGDIAIGDPDYAGESGQVTVWHGGATWPGSSTRLSQSTPNIAGEPAPFDRFGQEVSAGDVNRDGYADLAIGVHGEDIGGRDQSGAVQVLRGGPGGLTGTGSRTIDRRTAGVPGDPVAYDSFGYHVRLHDSNRDGYADLFVDSSAYPALRLPGSASGITTTGLTQLPDQYIVDGILQ